MPAKIADAARELAQTRARHLCEYCHTNERWQYVRFTIDHIVPLSEGGTNAPDNLALACFHCNRRKSGKRVALDNLTQQTVPLFNPRLDDWRGHFIWSVDRLRVLPLTATARATIELLDMNRARILLIRQADASVNRHPPANDPIEPASAN